jgi:hypothetical protein
VLLKAGCPVLVVKPRQKSAAESPSTHEADDDGLMMTRCRSRRVWELEDSKRQSEQKSS